VRDEHHAKAIDGNVNERQADAVHGDGALADHLGRKLGRAREPDRFPLALLDPFGDVADAVHVTLYEVPAEPVAQAHGPLQIDAIPDSQLAEIGASKSLGSGLKSDRIVIAGDYGEASPVDRDTFPQPRIVRKPTGCDQ
jgi:hypothetical protein